MLRFSFDVNQAQLSECEEGDGVLMERRFEGLVKVEEESERALSTGEWRLRVKATVAAGPAFLGDFLRLTLHSTLT